MNLNKPNAVAKWPSGKVTTPSSHSATQPLSHRDGLLLVNKPRGMTSHDVVALMRRKLGIRRIGHAGTLDPMAEGLLILLVGRATTHQHALQGHDKSYEAVIRLGTKTDTADAEGRPVQEAPVPPFDRAHVERLLMSLEGEHAQRPPAYSAVKVQGRPAYWWARRNAPVTLAERSIRLARMALIHCTRDTVAFRVDCSAGTYIRTLAETIAERLGTVGHLISLTRTRVGEWSLPQAKSVAWIHEADASAVIRELQPAPATPS